MQHTIRKLSTGATIFFHTSFQLEVCTQNYRPPKLQESQLWEFRDSHLGVLGQNGIPVAMHRVHYKGEGGGFPQVQAMVSLVNLWLPRARLCTKVLQLRIN